MQDDSPSFGDEKVRFGREQNSLANQRTRFSAERTLSAWMRTGLASVGGGFAILRLLVFENVTHRLLADVIGEILLFWGIVIFIFALRDYHKTCIRLNRLESGSNQLWITITALIFTVVSLLLFFVTLT